MPLAVGNRGGAFASRSNPLRRNPGGQEGQKGLSRMRGARPSRGEDGRRNCEADRQTSNQDANAAVKRLGKTTYGGVSTPVGRLRLLLADERTTELTERGFGRASGYLRMKQGGCLSGSIANEVRSGLKHG